MSEESGTTLDRSLVQGIAWLGGMKWMTQIVSWSVTLIVAHLLMPEDYGLFGMAMVYIGLIQFAGEAGLLASIVKPPVLEENVVAQLGGFAVMLGIALTSFSMGIASLIAWFFHEWTVRGLITLLSVTFVLRGLQGQPRGLLVRRMQFRRVAWIDAVETFVLTLSTLGYALLGFHYWSLALGVVTGVAASTVLCLTWCPHRIAFPRDFSRIGEALTVGVHVLAAQLAWYAYTNADFVIVGRVLGRAALGAYTFSWTIASLAVERVSSLVVRVMPPIFAAVQNDPVAVRRYLCSITEGLALVTMPACIGLSLVADVLITSLLGPTWSAAIVPLRLLGIYATFRCVIAVLPQVLIFTGHSKRSMQFSVTAAIVMPVSFMVGTHWGAAGVAWAWILVYPLLMMATYIRYVLRVVGLTAREYFASLWPALSATLVMSAVVMVLRALLPHTIPVTARLAMLVISGAVSYAAFTFALHGERLRTTITLLKNRNAAPPAKGGAALGDPPVDAPVTPSPVPHHPLPTVGSPAYVTGAPTNRPRMLLISYHFPPDPAIGSLRWQKFARYAAARGWELDVIMRSTSGIGVSEPERVRDLPAGMRVYGVALRPLAIERLENWLARAVRRFRRPPDAAQAAAFTPATAISQSHGARDILRSYFCMVDRARGRRWGREAADVAMTLAAKTRYRAVISSSPPHFVHEAAYRVARMLGAPLVVDMRDPWSLAPHFPESLACPLTLRMAEADERRVIDQAALVVVNTEPMRRAMERRYPRAARIIAVPNGFDEAPAMTARRDPRFLIAYAGTIYLDRDPLVLFRALRSFVARHSLTPADAALEFMGDVKNFDGVPLDELARREDVGDFVRLHARQPRADALAFLGSASVLVQLPQDTPFAIPAKLYEYMLFDAWLLVLARKENASAAMLEGLDADVVDPADAEAIAGALSRRYEQHRRGEHGERLARHEQFSRRARAATLFDAIEQIAGRPATHPESLRREQPPQGFQHGRPGVAPPPDLRVVLPRANPKEVTQHSPT